MPSEKDKSIEVKIQNVSEKDARIDDFVLEKNIFSNIFEKDIRRVFIYKKAERLAKAIHLVTPAFADSVSLRNRMDTIAVGLVDAAIGAPAASRAAFSRELLALSSVLSIARAGGLLSAMNAELIAREGHLLLQEVAAYEEPRLFLDDAPTLADLVKRSGKREALPSPARRPASAAPAAPAKGHIKDTTRVSDTNIKDRRDTIVSVISRKGGNASIKDISTLIRDISEKTIQRELQALVESGVVLKQGERRWSTYSLP